MADSNFWATSAQTMPVLALAIVVEARAVMSRWKPGERRVDKAVQGLLWRLPLLSYVVAIDVCFYALSGTRWGTDGLT
ncbi:MAG: hypothetical protein QOG10_1305 [Kribbellaceae bacterium]|jgi:hypothetical protein|nr:hypothetical protein [Kribbellaceae bacterium]